MNYLAFLLVILLTCPHYTESALKLVHVVWRHGDRAPMEAYPNDPNPSVDIWPKGWQQLTKVGMNQMYDVGAFLRTRFNKNQFLPQRYSNTDMRLTSSESERAFQSALAVLAGLYPPTPQEVWKPDLLWQPIPMRTNRKMLQWRSCPKVDDQEREKFNDLQEKLFADNEDLYRMMIDNAGYKGNWKTGSHLWRVFENTVIAKLHGLKVPSWITDDVFNRMERVMVQQSIAKLHDDDLVKARTGDLLKDIVSHINTMKQNKTQPKAYLYSSHDYLIIAFMYALGVYNEKPIPYAATVILEIHSNTTTSTNPSAAAANSNNDYIEIYYRNQTDQSKPIHLPIKGCGLSCPLSEFLNKISHLVPDNLDVECEATPEPGVLTGGILYGLIAAIGIVIILVIVLAVYLTRRHKGYYMKSSHEIT